MNTIDITTIIELALGIIIAIPMVIIIPKIKAWAACKLSAKQIEIAKIIIKAAVSAAEQIYINSEKSGSSKKKYVMEYAKNKLESIGFTFDTSEIEVYLEQAVKDMNDNKFYLDVTPEISG